MLNEEIVRLTVVEVNALTNTLLLLRAPLEPPAEAGDPVAQRRIEDINTQLVTLKIAAQRPQVKGEASVEKAAKAVEVCRELAQAWKDGVREITLTAGLGRSIRKTAVEVAGD